MTVISSQHVEDLNLPHYTRVELAKLQSSARPPLVGDTVNALQVKGKWYVPCHWLEWCLPVYAPWLIVIDDKVYLESLVVQTPGGWIETTALIQKFGPGIVDELISCRALCGDHARGSGACTCGKWAQARYEEAVSGTTQDGTT